LKKTTPSRPNSRSATPTDRSITVLHEDATRVSTKGWYRHGDVRVIGNLPYSVGSEILKHLLTPPTPVTRAVFMLQKEVCQRLAAKVGQDGYGAPQHPRPA
jgi:16S rRNA (adenine1518-N6/adenine1519-N6)-dimethyltransferase